MSVDDIEIEDEQAIIALTRTLNLGGVCDNPRVMGQLSGIVEPMAGVLG